MESVLQSFGLLSNLPCYRASVPCDVGILDLGWITLQSVNKVSDPIYIESSSTDYDGLQRRWRQFLPLLLLDSFVKI